MLMRWMLACGAVGSGAGGAGAQWGGPCIAFGPRQARSPPSQLPSLRLKNRRRECKGAPSGRTKLPPSASFNSLLVGAHKGPVLAMESNSGRKAACKGGGRAGPSGGLATRLAPGRPSKTLGEGQEVGVRAPGARCARWPTGKLGVPRGKAPLGAPRPSPVILGLPIAPPRPCALQQRSMSSWERPSAAAGPQPALWHQRSLAARRLALPAPPAAGSRSLRCDPAPAAAASADQLVQLALVQDEVGAVVELGELQKERAARGVGEGPAEICAGRASSVGGASHSCSSSNKQPAAGPTHLAVDVAGHESVAVVCGRQGGQGSRNSSRTQSGLGAGRVAGPAAHPGAVPQPLGLPCQPAPARAQADVAPTHP